MTMKIIAVMLILTYTTMVDALPGNNTMADAPPGNNTMVDALPGNTTMVDAPPGNTTMADALPGNTTMADAPPGNNCLKMENGLCTCCKTGWTGFNCSNECKDCRWKIGDNGDGQCSLSCSPGKWGNKSCDSDCPKNCILSSGKSVCNISTGVCDECPQGYHGERCEEPCRHTCLDELCYQGNGTCKSCANGSYGNYCENKCADGCFEGKCSSNGSCLCKPGWTGTKCRVKCDSDCVDKECFIKDGRSQCKGGLIKEQSRDDASSCTYHPMVYDVIIHTSPLVYIPIIFWIIQRFGVPEKQLCRLCRNKTDTNTASDQQEEIPLMQRNRNNHRGVQPEDDDGDQIHSLHGVQISNP